MEQSRPAGMSRNRYCKMMRINRTRLYYEKKGESAENVAIMSEMDCIYMEHPTMGKRALRDYLRTKGYQVNVKRVRRLMEKMGMEPIYPKRCLSCGGVAKYIHPYLLRNLQITRRNQVWSTDISYIPMQNGFMYLYAIMDVHSRYLLGIYLTPTDNVQELREGIDRWIRFYNFERPHQGLDGAIPSAIYKSVA